MLISPFPITYYNWGRRLLRKWTPRRWKPLITHDSYTHNSDSCLAILFQFVYAAVHDWKYSPLLYNDSSLELYLSDLLLTINISMLTHYLRVYDDLYLKWSTFNQVPKTERGWCSQGGNENTTFIIWILLITYLGVSSICDLSITCIYENNLVEEEEERSNSEGH